jgi:hypothetical protein
MKILLVTVAHYGDQPGGSQKIAFDEEIELKEPLHKFCDVGVIA